MNEKKRIRYPIIVEGRYDRQRILDIFDADCISTDGFGIFNSKQTNATIRALASKGKLIVLTDSDSAGALIRKRISQSVGNDNLINLYTPQVKGKERRKKEPSKQGFLGVEGMSKDVIQELLSPFVCGEGEVQYERVTKLDFYLDGFSGGKNSSEMRDKLASVFSLPSGMSANALLTALCYVASREEYKAAALSVRQADEQNK